MATPLLAISAALSAMPMPAAAKSLEILRMSPSLLLMAAALLAILAALLAMPLALTRTNIKINIQKKNLYLDCFSL